MKGHAFIIAIGLGVTLFGCSQAPDSTKRVEVSTPKGPEAATKLAGLKSDTVEPGKGDGAKVGDMLTMLYRGTLANGTVFDGNMDENHKPLPAKDPFALTLGMGMVIKGWDQGLVGMKVGEIRKLAIPAALGYGEQATGAIPPNSDLFFTVKCLDIIRQGEEMVIDTTEVKVGSGPAVKNGDKVSIHYVGKLLNDKKFDSSRDRKAPFVFTVGKGEVVPGFDKGVRGMKKGGIRKLRIPPQAAYGADPMGGIPANSVLLFEIELLAINGK
jgi:peptidylprolyl isomerase